MAGEKRVPGGDRSTIDLQAQSRIWAFEIPVKDHRKMPFDSVNQVQKVLLGTSLCDDAVEDLPENERPCYECAQMVNTRFGSRSEAFQQMPPAVLAGSQNIEIPAEAVRLTRFFTRHREPATLGEGCSLEPETESTQVVRCSRIEWTALA